LPKSNFKDFHDRIEETIKEVIDHDPSMAKEIDNLDEGESQIKIGKDIEIEHSMIDFQALIVGEKVRKY
jgi:hypothetical protein